MSPERYATLEAMNKAGNTLTPGELARMLGLKEETARSRLRFAERLYMVARISHRGKFNSEYTLTPKGLHVLEWCRDVWLPQQQMQGAMP